MRSLARIVCRFDLKRRQGYQAIRTMVLSYIAHVEVSFGGLRWAHHCLMRQNTSKDHCSFSVACSHIYNVYTRGHPSHAAHRMPPRTFVGACARNAMLMRGFAQGFIRSAQGFLIGFLVRNPICGACHLVPRPPQHAATHEITGHYYGGQRCVDRTVRKARLHTSGG